MVIVDKSCVPYVDEVCTCPRTDVKPWPKFCWPSHWGRPVVHGSICDNLDAYENPPIHPSTVVLAMHAPLLHPLWFDVTLLTRSDGVAVNIKLVGCVDRNAKRGYV